MSKSIKHIPLYRNGAVLATKELAVARLNQFASVPTFAIMEGVANWLGTMEQKMIVQQFRHYSV